MNRCSQSLNALFTGAFACALLMAAGTATYAQKQANASDSGAEAAGAAAPVGITLPEAIRRAEASEPAFAAARGASQSAALDRSIARAGLLPNARFYSQDIYTQPNGIYTEGDAGEPSAPLPRFVANDSRPGSILRRGLLTKRSALRGRRRCAARTQRQQWPAPSRRSRGAAWWWP